MIICTNLSSKLSSNLSSRLVNYPTSEISEIKTIYSVSLLSLKLSSNCDGRTGNSSIYYIISSCSRV